MLQESASAAVPSSLWASMASWLTPTVLFLLLNLMIGTIALISSFTHQQTTQHRQHEPHDHVTIARSPSVLQRLKSINFYNYRSHQDHSASHHNPSTDSAATLSNNLNLQTQSHSNHFVQEDDYSRTAQQQDSYVHPEPRETDAQFDFDREDSILDGSNPAQEEKNAEGENEFQSMDEIYSQLVKGTQFGRTKSDTEPGLVTNRAQNPARMRKSASLKTAFARPEETAAVEARRPATVRERVLAKVTDGDEEVDAKADDFINNFKQQLKLQRLNSILGYKEKIRRGFGGR